MKDFQKSATWDAEHRLLFCTSTGFITCTTKTLSGLFASPLADTYILLQPPPSNTISSLPQYWFHNALNVTKNNASLDLFASPLTGTYILCTSTRSINSKPNLRPSANHNLAFKAVPRSFTWELTPSCQQFWAKIRNFWWLHSSIPAVLSIWCPTYICTTLSNMHSQRSCKSRRHTCA